MRGIQRIGKFEKSGNLGKSGDSGIRGFSEIRGFREIGVGSGFGRQDQKKYFFLFSKNRA